MIRVDPGGDGRRLPADFRGLITAPKEQHPMNEAQARLIVETARALDLADYIHCQGFDGDWSVGILFRDGRQTYAFNVPDALTMVHRELARYTFGAEKRQALDAEMGRLRMGVHEKAA